MSALSVHEMARVASRIWGVPVADILGKSRFHEHVLPRLAVYEAARDSGKSYGQIGRAMDRDWSTVRDGVGKAANYARFDPKHSERLSKFRATVEERGRC